MLHVANPSPGGSAEVDITNDPSRDEVQICEVSSNS